MESLNRLIGTISFNTNLTGKRSAGKPHAAFDEAGDGNGDNELPRHYPTLLGNLTEMKNRGMQDMLIACSDNLTGMSDAISAAFPKTEHQLCIVHQIRNSLKYVSYKDRKEVAQNLKPIYQAATEEEAMLALGSFEAKWKDKYPQIAKSWYNNWANLVIFLDYPESIRKIIYTTNMLESFNSQLRRVTSNKRVFPNDEAVFKTLYLTIQYIVQKWTMPIQNWNEAMAHFIIKFEGRV